jgi:excinuclease UvrABC nuclease subunit
MENWTLTWTKLTLLDKASLDKIPDELAGIYRLSYKGDDDGIYVFYVGQALDIKTRLLQHLSPAELNEKIKYYLTKQCYFRYAQINKDYIRDAAEKQMYKQYQPPCNEKEPQGRDDVKVNLT